MKKLKIFKSKKGLEMKIVVSFLIGIVILAVLISFIKQTGSVAQDAAYKIKCKKSVDLYAKSNAFDDLSKDVGTSKETESGNSGIDCPTQYVSIKSKTKNDIKRDIAYQVSHCWDNYGRGEKPIFREEDSKLCAVCSVLEFKKKGVLVDDFVDYLAKKEIPQDIPFRSGMRPSHFQFITGTQPTLEQLKAMRITDDETSFPDTINTDEDYMVLFTFYKESEWYNWGAYGAAIGTGVAAVALIIGGAVTAGSTSVVGTVLLSSAFTQFAVAGAAVGGAAAGKAAKGDDAGEWVAGIAVTPFKNESFKKFGCEQLPVKG